MMNSILGMFLAFGSIVIAYAISEDINFVDTFTLFLVVLIFFHQERRT